MTQPQPIYVQPFPFGMPNPADEEAWIRHYAAVQQNADARMRLALVHAANEAQRTVIRLGAKDGIGAKVRTAQVNSVRKSIKSLVTRLFSKQIGPIIRDGRLAAVEAAARASMSQLQPFLREVWPIKWQRKAFEDNFAVQARRNIDTMMVRVTGASYVPLSRRVYKTTELANGWVDNTVNSALARGDSAREIAAAVRSSIHPGARGGVSYAAFRLGRTELNNAFHAQSIGQAEDSPWIADMRWNLSKTHKSDPGDLCERYALIGTFPKSAVPLRPHPQCKCFVTPEMIGWDEFRATLLAGGYDEIKWGQKIA